MKGIIIEQMVHDGVMDYIHGGGWMLKRIVIPEQDYLSICVHDGKVVVVLGANLSRDFKVLATDVEIPDKLIGDAEALIQAQKAVDNWVGEVGKILGL